MELNATLYKLFDEFRDLSKSVDYSYENVQMCKRLTSEGWDHSRIEKLLGIESKRDAIHDRIEAIRNEIDDSHCWFNERVREAEAICKAFDESDLTKADWAI